MSSYYISQITYKQDIDQILIVVHSRDDENYEEIFCFDAVDLIHNKTLQELKSKKNA